MSRKIFVNLPVRDLNKSMAFYRALGFSINEQFTDETAACVVISESIYCMLLTHEKFQSFSPLPLADATEVTGQLLALNFESRQEVDEIVTRALASGGSTFSDPKDYGFMYQHSFQDPDGHVWEPFFMDMNAIPSQGN